MIYIVKHGLVTQNIPNKKKQISHKKYPTEHTILPFDDREAWIGDSWEKVASHQINNGNNRPNKVIFSLSVQPSASESEYIHCLQEEDLKFWSCEALRLL